MEQIGLQAVLDMSQFETGLRRFQSGINEMNASIGKIVSASARVQKNSLDAYKLLPDKNSRQARSLINSIAGIGIKISELMSTAVRASGQINQANQGIADSFTVQEKAAGKAAAQIIAAYGKTQAAAIKASGAAAGTGGGGASQIASAVSSFATAAPGATGAAAGFTAGLLKLDGELGNKVKMLNIVSGVLNAVGGIFVNVGRGGVSLFGNLIRSAASWVSHFTSTLAALVTNGLLKNLGLSLDKLAKAAYDAVDEFQKLEIRFTTLAARDYSKRFGVPLTEALTKVKDNVQGLIEWIRKVAVTTPFSVESIGKAIAMANAYGFNVQESQRLTLAVGDFTSALGLSNENMEMIIYHFGQMIALGKVTGREMLYLANNFVPVQEIVKTLADRYKVSNSEMKKMLSDGTVSTKEFINEFLKMADTDFKGAMERMSRTIAGATQNIKDFFNTVMGIEVFGPVGGDIAESLNKMITQMFQPEVMRSFTFIGLTIQSAFKIVGESISGTLLPALGKAWSALGLATPTASGFAKAFLFMAIGVKSFIDVIAQAIPAVASFLKDLLGRFGIHMESLGKDMISWGANLIISFARGMAAGIGAIINVLNSVARTITYWLSSHSPPRLLPDIDKWGRGAMESWLGGWATPSWSMFDEISGMMTNFLKSLGTDIIPEEKLLPRILGTREAIVNAIQAIKTGGSGIREAINSIFAPSGQSFGPLQAYVEAMNAKVLAQVKADEAQQILNDTTEKYEKILKGLNDQLKNEVEIYDDELQLRKIQKNLDTVILTTDERKRLNLLKDQILLKARIRATEEERDAAVAVAQTNLDTAKADLDNASAREEALKSLAEYLIENNNLLKEQADLLERIKKGKEGGSEDNTEEVPLDMGGFNPDAFGGTLESVKKKLKKEIDEMIAELSGKWKTFWDEFTKPFAGLGDKFNQLGGNWRGAWLGIQKWFGKVLVDLGDFAEEAKRKLQPLLDHFEQKVSPTIKASLGVAWIFAADMARNAMTNIGTDLSLLAEKLRGPDGEEAWWHLSDVITVAMDLATLAVVGWMADLSYNFAVLGTLISTASGAITGFGAGLVNTFNWVMDRIDYIFDDLTEVLQNAQKTLQDLLDGNLGAFLTDLGELSKSVTQLRDDILKAVEGAIFGFLLSITQGIAGGLVGFIRGVRQIGETINGIIEKVNAKWHLGLGLIPLPSEELINELMKKVIGWKPGFLGDDQTPKAPSNAPNQGRGTTPFEGAKGLDLIVPPGFWTDTFPVLAKSGERVTVTPQGFVPATNEKLIVSAVNSAIGAVASVLFSSSIRNASPTPQTVYYDNSVSIRMEPSYATYQSPSTVYHDVRAALVASRR